MNRLFKLFFLVIVLLIPVLIFLFLKFFGDNRFDIPIYHTDGVKVDFEECQFPADTFKVDATGLKRNLANVTVFFNETEDFSISDLTNTSARLKSLFPNRMSLRTYGLAGIEGTDIVERDTAVFYNLMHCNFVTDTMNQFILHDQRGLIRGYYGHELKEVDRLIVEMKILLENE